MDAFSVSIANALTEPKMRARRRYAVAGVYAFFQFLMPMLGWILVHTAASVFYSLKKFIPLIALLLLLYIGCKMIIESIKKGATGPGNADKIDAADDISAADNIADSGGRAAQGLTFAVLLMQGLATSIDALSAGFSIYEYGAPKAIAAALIIAAVTFCICTAGLHIGEKAGEKLSSRSGIFGGAILILIGLEIFIRG